jgi:rhodanese-related sulfurtransferase
MTHPISSLIAPSALRAALADRRELAILDVREEGVSGRRRLFYSSIAPIGRLGLLVGQLVPRFDTPIVLVDEAGEYAPRAAALLARFGYSDVSVLEGGVSGREAAGFEVFSGTNVPGKAFGELCRVLLARASRATSTSSPRLVRFNDKNRGQPR